MIKVSIIEDNRQLGISWQSVINVQNDMAVVGLFGSCEAALAAENSVKETQVLLLDIELPGVSGIKGVTQLLQLNPSLLPIMITVHEDDDHIYSALRNGAVGYLNKNTNPQVLIESIKVAVDGGSPMSPNIARKVIQNFQQDNKVVQLTEQELIILEALAEGLSYKMVAKKIFLSVDGVRYHIRNIYSKLDAKNRADAISKAYAKNIFRRSE
ncbi:response regulator transcription factor [Balneolaceae bacterium]|jgi:DNA-binding NarL/FixJ family response regulator|nr:response regulator transcription factor [Balneolaceae bacterium]